MLKTKVVEAATTFTELLAPKMEMAYRLLAVDSVIGDTSVNVLMPGDVLMVTELVEEVDRGVETGTFVPGTALCS